MARTRKLEAEKRRFLARADARPWLRSVGIGKIDDELGLVISVAPSAKSACRRLVNEIALDVPVAIRGVGEIRARPSVSGVARDAHLERLRREALRRLG